MFSFSGGLKVYVRVEPTDMRKSFDALAALAGDVLGQSPRSGNLFVFFNRSYSRAKILLWEGGGYWILYRRLERGNFKLPLRKDVCGSMECDTKELLLILEGLDLEGTKYQARFERLVLNSVHR
jgi:transposase